MGLSIHYRGRLDDVGRLGLLCHDLTDIADTMKWPWRRLDEDWGRPASARLAASKEGCRIDGHLPLKGILLTVHPGCEALRLFFDREGDLRDPIAMAMAPDEGPAPQDAYVSVKTQFSSPGVHITLIKLLRYLKKRYIFDLDVRDEGDYWQTGDEGALREKMSFLSERIDWVADVLSTSDAGDAGNASNLSPASLADRIEHILAERLAADTDAD